MSDGMSTSSHFYFISFFFFSIEVAIEFFSQNNKILTINYLEDTLFTYIEVA